MSTASSHAAPREPRRPHVSAAQRTEEARTAFDASLRSVATNVDYELQSRAKNIHAMDKSLTKQEKDLSKDTQKLAKQNDEMQNFVEQSNKQLAQFDDLGAQYANLGSDLEDIEELLRALEDDDSQGTR